jgi:hypothetical protein
VSAARPYDTASSRHSIRLRTVSESAHERWATGATAVPPDTAENVEERESLALPDGHSSATMAISLRAMILLLALVLAPFVVSAATIVVHDRGYRPIGDLAQNELRTRDVPRHLPLTGPFSRDNWFHPGPMYYYVLAVPYRLLGSTSIAILLAALLINAAAIAGMAVIARRHGGTELMLVTLVGCSVLLAALGPSFVRNPWNPLLPVLPYGLLLFLVWAMVCGDAWAMPVAAVVATFVTQTHVGFALLALPLLFAGAGALLVRSWRARGPDASSRRAACLRAGLWAIGLLFLLWLPPVVDQIKNPPGNLRLIVRYFRHPNAPLHPMAQGVKLLAAQLGFRPEWIVGAGKASPFTGEPILFYQPVRWPVLVIALVGAVFVFWRRRRVDALALVAVVTGAALLGVLAVARTIGPALEYRLRFALVIGMLAGVTIAWAGWIVASGWRAAAARVLTGAAVVAIVSFSISNSIGAAQFGLKDIPGSSDEQRLVAGVRSTLPGGDGAVVVDSTSFASSAYATGLVLALERAGLPARVPHRVVAGAGAHRVYQSGPLRAWLTVVSDASVDAPEARKFGQLVAYTGSLGRAEHRRRVVALNGVVVQCAKSADPRACYLRLLAMASPGTAVAVYLSTRQP